MKTTTWLWGIIAIAIVWAVLGLLMVLMGRQVVTAQEIEEMVSSTELASLSDQDRQTHLAQIADAVNRLEFEERQQLRQRRVLRPVIDAMSEEERTDFLRETLPSGFGQLMDSLNKMDPEKRKRLVERALNDMRSREDRFSEEDRARARESLGESAFQVVVEEGFDAYLQKANAQTKLDLAPLIEQIQINLQRMRR